MYILSVCGLWFNILILFQGGHLEVTYFVEVSSRISMQLRDMNNFWLQKNRF